MQEGIILSIFDEASGFIPNQYIQTGSNETTIKNIIFRTTLFLVGGSNNIADERESLIELPENEIIGCSYMNGFEAKGIRGGKMPIVLILFTDPNNKSIIYNNISEIMNILKAVMNDIKPKWTGNKFKDTSQIKEVLNTALEQFKTKFSGSADESIQSKEFKVKCPNCDLEMELRVPLKIRKLLSINVNGTCKHNFEAYFTEGPEGPEFRGTSKSEGTISEKKDLKSIFDNL